MNIPWYVARLRRMGPRELASRVRDGGLKAGWRRLMGRDCPVPVALPAEYAPFLPALPALEEQVVAGILEAADGLLAGRLRMFGREVPLPDEGDDWFFESQSGVAAPGRAYAFDIDTRDAAVVGNHKFLLEPARLQHVPLLAAAFFLSGKEAYAEKAAQQLRSWWQANPFLVGVHWTSGIEIGLRLVSFAWTRRLLDRWPGVADCFEGSRLARAQIYWHQFYLAGLRSRGSSANNHLLAELLGLYVGANAFPWYPESRRWRAQALGELESETQRQVFPDGINRELASDYHGFVLELLLVGAIEGAFSDLPPGVAYRDAIARMADAWAALMDCRQRPPRQGDGDDGNVLLLDPPGSPGRAGRLLAAAGAVVGARPWWPSAPQDFRSRLFAALAVSKKDGATLSRAGSRPNLFPQAGIAILRDLAPREDEIWCRCDHGPHGFLSIAAHAHADALSVELRHGGIDILADPGTYCYRTEPEFRRYVRSTIAHNTLEIGGADQATFGGPFLWLDAPASRLLELVGLDGGALAGWRARHEGYARKPGAPVHLRQVILDRAGRTVRVLDRVEGAGEFSLRLAFHLGPAVTAALDGAAANLAWINGARRWHARLELPASMAWRSCRGSLDPVCGWYSRSFGEREPATALIGEATLPAGTGLETLLRFLPDEKAGQSP